jgi:hypothetical protein
LPHNKIREKYTLSVKIGENLTKITPQDYFAHRKSVEHVHLVESKVGLLEFFIKEGRPT